MKVQLIDGTGISLTGEWSEAICDVIATREGPHGTLYYILGEWYAARRFKIVEDDDAFINDVAGLQKQLHEAQWTESYLRKRVSELENILDEYGQDIRKLRAEVEGLKGDVKTAEDNYTRAKEQLDQAPREVTGERLFEDWENKDLAEYTELWIWHCEDGKLSFRLIEDIVPDPFGNDARMVCIKDSEGELVFPYDNCIIKQLPKLDPQVAAKNWLVTYAEWGEPKTTGLVTYKEARSWLLCNGENPEFSPVMIYKRCESGQVLIMTLNDFMDPDNAERWPS